MAALKGPRIAIVGLGAIGGSLALKLLERDTPVRAHAADPADARLASEQGLSVAVSVADAVHDADIVVIAVPLDAITEVAHRVVAAARARATMLHVGSLQRREALGASTELHERLLGSHPLAGTHRQGFPSATRCMFGGAVVSVEERASPRERSDAELLWSLAGAARVEYRSAVAHDRLMSWMSHLPQLASTALAATLYGAHVSPAQLGPGGRDATRLAGSSFGMWRPILSAAPAETALALRSLEDTLARLRAALESGDEAALATFWDCAVQWRLAADQTVGAS